MVTGHLAPPGGGPEGQGRALEEEGERFRPEQRAPASLGAAGRA